MPVRVYPETLTVKITRDDIKNGICEDTYKCALACAFKRDIGTTSVYVSSGTSIYVLGAGKHRKVRYTGIDAEMESKISSFILDFDDNKKVKPCVFKLKRENYCF